MTSGGRNHGFFLANGRLLIAQGIENRFNVLAGAQSIGAKVGTGAGIIADFEAAQSRRYIARRFADWSHDNPRIRDFCRYSRSETCPRGHAAGEYRFVPHGASLVSRWRTVKSMLPGRPFHSTAGMLSCQIRVEKGEIPAVASPASKPSAGSSLAVGLSIDLRFSVTRKVASRITRRASEDPADAEGQAGFAHGQAVATRTMEEKPSLIRTHPYRSSLPAWG